METKDDDPRELKKKNAELLQKLADREALIQLLTSLPKPRSEPSMSESPTPSAKTRSRRAGVKAEAGGGSVPAEPAPQAR